ncbi:arginine N-succinyltransferase [Vibrio sp. PP-XX7]
MLEETKTAKVVGICGIEAAIGLDEPWYNYRVGTLVHASKTLDVYSQMPTLFLSNDHTGHSELCTLFLDPAYPGIIKTVIYWRKAVCCLLQRSLNISPIELIAEMRGVSDSQGRSPFWESLGRHFFAIDFAHAELSDRDRAKVIYCGINAKTSAVC